MRKITILLLLALFTFSTISADAASRKRHRRARTTRVVHKKPVILSVHDKDPWSACEDTCQHIHGIDVSHYQNDVFWKAVGEETNMAYAYLKASGEPTVWMLSMSAISNWLICMG